MTFRFLKILKSANTEILDLLNRNVIGTPGQGMLYQHTTVADKISKIQDPYFVSLAKSGHIIGVCCFCKRTMVVDAQPITSFYIRYFSFDPLFRRKLVIEKTQIRKSEIRNEIKEVLNGKGLITKQNDPFFHYAYVDPRNTRSARLCSEFGFEPVRQYATVIFNRLSPQRNAHDVHELSFGDESKMKELLSDSYRDFNMFSLENLFGLRKYYIVKDDDGNILAGAQANADHWNIHALPRFFENVLLKVFSRLPVLNKLINRNYHFISVEGIYYKPGAEAKLEVLFESLLHKYEVNSAIIVIDSQTALYKTLKSLRLGVINKISSEAHGNVICRFSNLSESARSHFKTKPAYISGIDVT